MVLFGELEICIKGKCGWNTKLGAKAWEVGRGAAGGGGGGGGWGLGGGKVAIRLITWIFQCFHNYPSEQGQVLENQCIFAIH